MAAASATPAAAQILEQLEECLDPLGIGILKESAAAAIKAADADSLLLLATSWQAFPVSVPPDGVVPAEQLVGPLLQRLSAMYASTQGRRAVERACVVASAFINGDDTITPDVVARSAALRQLHRWLAEPGALVT